MSAFFALLVALALSSRGRLRPARDRADAFFLIAVLWLAVYLLAPAGFSGGFLLKERLSLFPFLLLLPWFAAGLSDLRRLAQTTASAALVVLAIVNAGYVLYWYRLLDRQVSQFLEGLSDAPSGTRGLAVVFDRLGASSNTDIYGHAFARVALERYYTLTSTSNGGGLWINNELR